ncbi:tetratricopeptide repeat 38 [Brachionus plicatilis]|uniref:Tetratricopeptide repeat protein 38 n=1 Tax=Brachionus plicatilis TaxID=10195 RepID=A0A3M7S1M4_BRAPC|nr:tetratricopeptide repeat 38 [Brachionus plicatilis]
MHSNWRDCRAWYDEKLPMNTNSNEASKFYDICLSQLAGYYENHQFGGIVGSLTKMTSADPNFILGQCLKSGIELLGTNATLTSDTYQKSIQDLVAKSEALADQLTLREKLHVRAIQHLAKGDLPESVTVWEDILIDHPTDMMAVRMSAGVYFYLGDSIQMRDSIARILPKWNQRVPLFNYLYGYYAFGLTQTKELEKAGKHAKMGIEMNRQDGWACHAIAHVNEYASSPDKGIEFLLSTQKDWNYCDFIRGHNYWHLCLFYLEKQEYGNVLDILDNNEAFLDPKMSIDMINVSSLLSRLKLDGFNDKEYLRKKFDDLKKKFGDRIDQHGYMYSDFHMALIYSMVGSEQEKEMYTKSMEEFIGNESVGHFIRNLNDKLGRKIVKALFDYGEKNFDKSVDLLYPIRYELKKIGGSNAQRDIFNLILIDSCMRSKFEKHNRMGAGLLFERLAQRDSSPLTNRIADRFFVHDFYNNF